MLYKMKLEEKADKFRKHAKPYTYVMPPSSENEKSSIPMDCKIVESKSKHCFQSSTSRNSCSKCLFLRRVWMIAVNLYDFMSLLDVCPCGTLHPICPYIT